MIVKDVDAHYEKACSAGAEIVLDIVDHQGHGGRGYTCKDLESSPLEFWLLRSLGIVFAVGL
jgi:uncharacterized glyoxalase superfamily protein PhnB